VAVATSPTAAVLTPRPDLAPLEVVGSRAALDRLVAVPPRWSLARPGARLCRLAPRRAVILAEPGAAEQWCGIGIRDRSGGLGVVEVSGSDASGTLTAAGLNCRLPIDALWTGSIAGVFALVVREGPDRFLLLAPALYPLTLS
jgi:hypothetical protein